MNTTADGPIVRAENLALRFEEGRIGALDGLDLEIMTGEFVAIAGPSGCGKSSLLALIGMLDIPTSGQLYFRSRPYSQIADRPLFRRRHIGFVFQSFHLIPTLSALENVLVPTVGQGGAERARRKHAEALLERVGLAGRMHQLPGTLSGGERQRVAIARALVNDPEMVLADEPTGSLDSRSAEVVLHAMADLQKRAGLTVVMVTHDAAISARADRVVHMRDGRAVAPQGKGH